MRKKYEKNLTDFHIKYSEDYHVTVEHWIAPFCQALIILCSEDAVDQSKSQDLPLLEESLKLLEKNIQQAQSIDQEIQNFLDTLFLDILKIAETQDVNIGDCPDIPLLTKFREKFPTKKPSFFRRITDLFN